MFLSEEQRAVAASCDRCGGRLEGGQAYWTDGVDAVCGPDCYMAWFGIAVPRSCEICRRPIDPVFADGIRRADPLHRGTYRRHHFCGKRCSGLHNSRIDRGRSAEIEDEAIASGACELLCRGLPLLEVALEMTERMRRCVSEHTVRRIVNRMTAEQYDERRRAMRSRRESGEASSGAAETQARIRDARHAKFTDEFVGYVGWNRTDVPSSETCGICGRWVPGPYRTFEVRLTGGGFEGGLPERWMYCRPCAAENERIRSETDPSAIRSAIESTLSPSSGAGFVRHRRARGSGPWVQVRES